MNRTNQPFLKVLIIGILVIGVAGTAIILGGELYRDLNAKILYITYSVLIYGITASVCWAVTRKNKYRGLGTTGIIVSVLAALLNVALAISETGTQDVLQIAFTFFIVAISMAHICFLFYITIQNKYAEAARTVAVIFISIFSLLAIIKIFNSSNSLYLAEGMETYARLLMVALTINLTATLLVPLCNRLRPDTRNDLTFNSDPTGSETDKLPEIPV